ncbi:lysophospholipid acyltransferase family protein [Thiomicrospira pelophila]|uniref:lysophospholipid acyltransferase family protein n=1 Tax=Thiomicrospira pelophila TaxID=934 RepID=UPI0004A737AA|nr:lipid A biosynthesis acyltransferase [Thiomicrospira pelophila]
MKKSSEHHPIQGALFKGLVRSLSWLPLKWNQRLGAAIGWLLWRLPNSAKRVSIKNIEIAFPNLTTEARAQLVKKSLIETGKTATELGAIWCWSQAKKLALIKRVEGAERLEQAVSQGKGVMVLSPHVGCWEIIGHYLAEQYPTTILYRPPRIGSLDNFMRQARQSSGVKLQPTDMSGVKGLRKALKNAEVVGILPDQDPGKSGGVVAPFFGQPANTMVLVSKLAQKSQCPVFYIVAERLPNAQGYVIHLLDAPAEVASADEQEATSALNQGVETCVRQLPSQYQWSYKRYKNLPKGYAKVY